MNDFGDAFVSFYDTFQCGLSLQEADFSGEFVLKRGITSGEETLTQSGFGSIHRSI